VLEADAREDRQVMLRLGEVLIGLQEYAQAIDVYRRLLAHDPQDADDKRRPFAERRKGDDEPPGSGRRWLLVGAGPDPQPDARFATDGDVAKSDQVIEPTTPWIR
jgi:hypothetical protein